jgi:hypothetical protein
VTSLGDAARGDDAWLTRDPRWPPTRFARWRLGSRLFAAVDGLVIALGGLVIVVPLVVALASWPSNRVLVAPTHLEHWAAVVLLPTWAWLIASAMLVYGVKQENYRSPWGPRPRARAFLVMTALGVVSLGTIIGGLVVGAAKGSLRVVDGQHQVSTGSLRGGASTTVSASGYRVWEARFLRLDAMFSLFGVVMVVFGAYFLSMHRSLTRTVQ